MTSRSAVASVLGTMLLFGLGAPRAYADIMVSFQGELLDNFVGTEFTAADQVTGSIVFDDFWGPTTTAAKSFTLATTVGGGPGYSFTVTDASSDSRVSLNTFTFAAGSFTPTTFGLTVSGPVLGGTEFDELSISNIGDIATIDFNAANESIGFNFSSGTFTVVPEPGFGSLLVACGAGLHRRRRS